MFTATWRRRLRWPGRAGDESTQSLRNTHATYLVDLDLSIEQYKVLMVPRGKDEEWLKRHAFGISSSVERTAFKVDWKKTPWKCAYHQKNKCHCYRHIQFITFLNGSVSASYRRNTVTHFSYIHKTDMLLKLNKPVYMDLTSDLEWKQTRINSEMKTKHFNAPECSKCINMHSLLYTI